MEERERIVEVEREPVVERHTTVVTSGDGGGGGGGTLLAVVLLVAALVVLFLLFGRGLLSSEGTDINVNVDVPEVDLPKVEPPTKPAR